MLRLLFLSVFFTGPLLARAQGTTMVQSTRDRIVLSGLEIPSYGFFYGVPDKGGQLLGDGYLDSSFQAGIIHFYGRIDSLKGVPVRLDLIANVLEVRASPTDIRAAKGPTIRQFAVNNGQGRISRFVNAREYRGEADEVNGFFEQVLPGASKPGQLELLVRPYVFVRRGNYNPALNVGTKDDQLVKKVDWYAAKNGRATRFSPGKKALLELMADKQAAMETYLKAEKPDLKTREGLLAVFTHYNSLNL